MRKFLMQIAEIVVVRNTEWVQLQFSAEVMYNSAIY